MPIRRALSLLAAWTILGTGCGSSPETTAPTATPTPAVATGDPATDWMAGRYGIGFHYLEDWMDATRDGGSAAWNAAVASFDVETFADAAAATGARWVLFTLGQNSGYYCAPNATLDRAGRYAPGERCSQRDLPQDMARALAARGLRLLLYLPCNAPKQDSRIAGGFGLTVQDSNGNWHASEELARNWSAVQKEWADRYGTSVAGWWLDGFYAANGFLPAWGRYYAEAARSGNPTSIIALNGGLSTGLARRSEWQQYVAGESQSLDLTCPGRWVDGAQCHVFIPLGGWGSSDIRFTDAQVLELTNRQLTVGGAVTWNLTTSPSGTINAAQRTVFERIRSRVVAPAQ